MVGFLHDYSEHVQNSRVEIGKSSDREVIGYWSSRGLVDRETIM